MALPPHTRYGWTSYRWQTFNPVTRRQRCSCLCRSSLQPCPATILFPEIMRGNMSRTLLALLVALLLAPLAIHAQTALSNIDDTSRLDWQHCTNPGCSGGKGFSTAGVANITESPPYNYTVDGTSIRFDLLITGCSSDCY